MTNAISRSSRTVGLLFLATALLPVAAATGPHWKAYSPSIFEQARHAGRLVMIKVTADWCAACRKMDEIGFRDPRVLDTLSRHYEPVRADIEDNSEAARLYGSYGVPALILLDQDGNEIMRRRGYLEPDWLYWLLAAVAADPEPESHQ